MDSFNEYLSIVKNTSVTVCPKCGSHNATNYDWLGNAKCFDCQFTVWRDEGKKFKYETVGMMS